MTLKNKSGKPYKCAHCKFKPAQFLVGLNKVCSIDCAVKLGKKKAAKVEKEKHKALKRKVKQENMSHQHKLTQTAFNRMRVMKEKLWYYERGLIPECISCGKKITTGKKFCCGHYKTVGASKNLRYDRMNTYLQCNYDCNSKKSGNLSGDKHTHGYTKGLLMRFGDIEGQKILDYLESHQSDVKRWTYDDVYNIRINAYKRIRELKTRLEQYE